MTDNCCPTCGSILRDQFAWDFASMTFLANGRAVRFGGTRAKIVDALWRHRNRGGIPNLIRFMELVYADDENGGPVSSNNVSVQLAGVRKMLEPAGFTVSRNRGNPKVGYKLLPIGAAE